MKKIQRLLSTFNYRIHNDKVIKETSSKFPKVQLLTVEGIAGGWTKALKEHFASGAKLDQLQSR